MEGNDGSCVIGIAYYLDRAKWFTLREFLFEDLTLAVNFCNKMVGKGIHAGHTHTMKTSGHLVAILTELTAGVKHRKNHLQGGTMLLFVHTGRDTTSVILYPYGVVRKNAHLYVGTESGHSLIYTVIHHFIYQMMQSPLGYISDIHRWSLSYGLQSLKHLNAVSTILLLGLFDFFCLYHFLNLFYIRKAYKFTKKSRLLQASLESVVKSYYLLASAVGNVVEMEYRRYLYPQASSQHPRIEKLQTVIASTFRRVIINPEERVVKV